MFLALATIAIAWFTLELRRSTDKTTQILRAANRPHIVVSDIKIRQPPIEGDPPEDGMIPFRLSWELANEGQITGVVDSFCALPLFPQDFGDFPPNPPYENIQSGTFVLAPKGMLGPSRPFGFKLNQSYTSGLRKGAERVFVFGFVGYHDDSGRRYENRFCYEIIFYDFLDNTGGSNNSRGFIPASGCPRSYQKYT